MARHVSGSRPGPNAAMKNRIYIVAGLVILAVGVAAIFGLGPFGGDKGVVVPPDDLDDFNMPVVATPDVNTPEVNEIVVAVPEDVTKDEPNVEAVKVDPNANLNPFSDAADLIAEAMRLLNSRSDRIIEARDRLNETLALRMSPKQRSFVKAQLTELSAQWLFGATFFPDDRLCGTYKVEPGDYLGGIARQYKVPYEILMDINGIRRPELLKAGQRIKVVNGPFHVTVYRSNFTMDVYLQNTYVKSFAVGLGRPSRQTPIGLWRIKAGGKLTKALYTDPDSGKVISPEDPAYPLGSRWMALEGMDEGTRDEKGFGIHGTKEPESIGRASSRGCIRLHNGDAIKIYDMLVPVYSSVRVEE